MKKYVKHFIIPIFILTICITSYAQRFTNAEDRIPIKERLGLSDFQKIQVDSISNRLMKTIMAIPAGLSAEARKPLIDKAIEQQLADLKSLLNTEQYDLYIRIMQERKKKIQDKVVKGNNQ